MFYGEMEFLKVLSIAWEVCAYENRENLWFQFFFFLCFKESISFVNWDAFKVSLSSFKTSCRTICVYYEAENGHKGYPSLA
ncbi:CLUMA_CG008876, isoform A [Clunio marinus]|uniref:CLUMA_CG008876, isoform A n=1 Tax=Clunio marinus TaxID=568069 RepID=A0A1J1I6F9_9DIPT|nr:CLUMA_CG008876, isoform A [Clunio marinus]